MGSGYGRRGSLSFLQTKFHDRLPLQNLTSPNYKAVTREIPLPAGESAGLRDDAGTREISTVSLSGHFFHQECIRNWSRSQRATFSAVACEALAAISLALR